MREFQYGIGQIVTLKSKEMISEEFGVSEFDDGTWEGNVMYSLPSRMYEDLYGEDLIVDDLYISKRKLSVLKKRKFNVHK